MSQKNGHALESVTLTAMLRRWTSSLLLIAVAAAGALSAMILQNLTIRQENALYITVAADMGESARLRIIGTVTNGPSNEIYCPYFMSWSEGVSVAFLTDSCSFDIRNNQKLEESKSYIYEWFVRPDLSNQMDGLTFGVLIHDETYQKNIEEIQANLSMLHLLLPVLIIVCGGIGFFASFLATRGRTKEFAVMRCLGMKQCKIFGLVMRSYIGRSLNCPKYKSGG